MGRCLVFPGQGSQIVGMGHSLAEAFPVAREVFEEVDDALGQNLSKIAWDGPSEELTLTSNAQPALMAHSMAMMRVLVKETGLDLENIMFVAGHSLGEYSALCAAKALSLSDTAKLLRIRGDAMQAACPQGEGAMAAVLGLDMEALQKAIASVQGAGTLEIANDNAPGQIVISGTRGLVEAFAADAKAHGAKMAKLLPVSAPFHSSLMTPAADKMREALDKANIKAPVVPLVANITAALTSSPDEVRRLLVEQVTGRVRWVESVNTMVNAGAEKFIEIGTGKVLAGLIKRISPDTPTVSLGEPGDIEAYLKF